MAGLLTAKRLVALAAVVAGGLLALTPAAQAADPSCGDTIHHSITLKHNLDCSSYLGDALTIDKDGVKLNLGGHTLTGPGGAAGTYSGVYNTEDDVTIKNGTIKNFYYNVYLYGGAKDVVTDVTFLLDGTRAYDGLYTEYTTGGRFNHITTKNADEALYIEYGSNNVIDHTTAIKCLYGVDIEEEAGSKATNNISKGLSGVTYGIYDYENWKVTWSNNVVNGGYYGVYSDFPTKVKFSKITANKNSYTGFYVSGNDPTGGYSATVSNSTANNNGDYGIYAEDQVGGRGNRALGNDSYDCYQARCNG